MERQYETMVIYDGTLSEGDVKAEHERIEKYFKEHVSMDSVLAWGRRQLYYTIKKKKSGYYYVYQYRGSGDFATLFDKGLKLNEKILRYMTVVRNLKAETKNSTRRARATEMAQVKSINMDDDN